MNYVCLLGLLGRDPEERTNANGTNYVLNTVAVRKEYKNKEGKYEYDNITFMAFANNAKYIAQYCKAKDKLLIQGSWTHSYYKDKDGKIINNDYLTVKSVEKVSSAKSVEKEVKKENTNEAPTFSTNEDAIEFPDGDLPF